MRCITATVAIVMGFAIVGCTRTGPTGPTPAGQITAQVLSDVAGAAWTSGSTSVSWSCFSGDHSCLTPRFRAHDANVSAVVTTAPTNLQAIVQGNNVGLTWGAPPGAQVTSYVIEVGFTPGAAQFAFDTGNTQTFLGVQGVPAGTYFVRVHGRDTSGTGPASNEVTVIVTSGGPTPCVTPGTPTNLTATVIGSRVALTWGGPSGGCDPESYIIEVGSSPGLTNIAQVDTGFDTRSFSVNGVPPGTYYVRVRARVGSTLSSPTGDVAVTVTGNAPAGSTRWVGLVANNDGITINNDPDCGFLRLDLDMSLVQSGSSVSGIVGVTIRAAAPRCNDAIGFTDTQITSGTVSGTFASGSGSFTAVTNAGTEDEIRINGTFADGRMTGSLAAADGATGTFTANRQ
jgi:hypothetical protein